MGDVLVVVVVSSRVLFFSIHVVMSSRAHDEPRPCGDDDKFGIGPHVFFSVLT